MTILLCTVFFTCGFILGIKAAEAVANRMVKDGKAFFYHEGKKTWVGDRDAIIRMIAKRRE